jgi:hypothetical protein
VNTIVLSYASADWTITQTFVWICFRSREDMDRAAVLEALADGAREEGAGIISPVLTLLEHAEPPKLLISIDDAESQLKERLSSGTLRCSGVHGTREALPVDAWSVRYFLLATNAVKDLTDGKVWTDILFRRSDILALWPPVGAAVQSRQLPTATALRSSSRQPPSDAIMSEWYIRRVAEWKSGTPPPTEKQDILAVREHWPEATIKRGIVRDLRRTHAPHWTAKSPTPEAHRSGISRDQ